MFPMPVTDCVVRDGVTGFPTDFVSEHLDLRDVAVTD